MLPDPAASSLVGPPVNGGRRAQNCIPHGGTLDRPFDRHPQCVTAQHALHRLPDGAALEDSFQRLPHRATVKRFRHRLAHDTAFKNTPYRRMRSSSPLAGLHQTSHRLDTRRHPDLREHLLQEHGPLPERHSVVMGVRTQHGRHVIHVDLMCRHRIANHPGQVPTVKPSRGQVTNRGQDGGHGQAVNQSPVRHPLPAPMQTDLRITGLLPVSSRELQTIRVEIAYPVDYSGGPMGDDFDIYFG